MHAVAVSVNSTEIGITPYKPSLFWGMWKGTATDLPEVPENGTD